MAYYVNNQAATDQYNSPGAISLGPFFDADTATILVSGNPVALQFYVGQYGRGHWTDEREFISPAGPGTINSFKVGNIYGVRARNASPGQTPSPIVSINLFHGGSANPDSEDPIFEAGAIYPGTITSGGVVGPVTGSLVINVKDQGAKGDALTDDTTAIQGAINACANAGGGIVFFPRGTYLTSATLTVPSFVALVGVGGPFRATEYGIDPNGVTSEILQAGAHNFDLIHNADTVNGNVSIEIRGLRLNQINSVADTALVVFNRVRRSRIEDCYLKGGVTTSRLGFRHIGASEQNLVMWTQLEGCGIDTANSNALQVLYCEFSQGGINFAEAANSGYFHQVTGCQIYQNGAGDPYPIPIGIKCVNLKDFVLRDNHVSFCRQHGILLYNGCKSGVVEGNRVRDNSQSNSGVFSGIALDSPVAGAANAVSGNQIFGNRCYDDQGAGQTQQYGITITSSAATTTGNLITSNDVSGNRSAGINIGGGTTGNTIRANVGFLTEASGAANIADGGAIAHGLAATPTMAQLTTSVGNHVAAATALGAVNITAALKVANTGAAVGVAETVYWEAAAVLG